MTDPKSYEVFLKMCFIRYVKVTIFLSFIRTYNLVGFYTNVSYF
jgi:hypothetical protein